MNWSKSPPASLGSWLSADQKEGLRRRVIIAGIVGNALEWYDFAVYGYFAAIIGKHFFRRATRLARPSMPTERLPQDF